MLHPRDLFCFMLFIVTMTGRDTRFPRTDMNCALNVRYFVEGSGENSFVTAVIVWIHSLTWEKLPIAWLRT